MGGSRQGGGQACEGAGVRGDDEDARAAQPGDVGGQPRGCATAAAAEDDLRLVAVFDAIRRRRGLRRGGRGNEAAQAGVEVVATGGNGLAVIQQAQMVGVAVGVVRGQVKRQVVAVAEGGGERGKGVRVEAAARVPGKGAAGLSEVTAVVARMQITPEDVARGQGVGRHKEKASHGSILA